MATTKISALTELTTPASADVLVINDDSAGSTKKIQLSNLIPDDAIDSEHYVAGSIDNEHLADDAVDSDELASGAVDIDHLSATGTPGTNYLRGDNTWATPTDTNTMGSGFTVSATTDSNATTITQGDDLMFTAGTGITTETTADGTVTIASTVTDTNTMGSGFTVSATTDSNATTITQGDDLMFTAGTGITCETTADGTVTISNTVSGASTATSSATGLIKIEDDTDQSVAAESVSTTANRTYGLQLNSSDQGVVNVPWTDTNTVFDPDGAQVFNESGADVDFRIEGSGEANALFVQGSDGNVGIGVSSPTSPLHVLASSAGQTVAKFESNQAGAVAVEIDAGADRDSFLRFQEAGTTRWDFWAQGSSGTNELNIRNESGTNLIQFKQDGRGLSQFTAKAWINFNGQSTVAIRDSHNVSSITDNGTGSYNVTMSNAMGSVNYSVTATSGRGAGEDMHALIPETAYNQTTTQFRILTLQSWDTAHDASYVSAHVFGD